MAKQDVTDDGCDAAVRSFLSAEGVKLTREEAVQSILYHHEPYNKPTKAPITERELRSVLETIRALDVHDEGARELDGDEVFR